MLRVWHRLAGGALAVLLVLAACASEMKPQDLAAEYYNLGNGFSELKKYDKAIRYYEMALERNPELASARWNLALAYYSSGVFDQAEQILLDALSRDPEAIEAREWLALVYRGQGRREEALAVLDDVLGIAPEDTLALNNKAIILWELERRPEAVEVFLRYLSYEPYHADTLYDIMLLYDEQGMVDRALEYAESFLAVAEADEKSPVEDRITASLIAARAYARAEVYYRALEIYGRVVELDEKQPDAWFEQAVILLTSVEDPGHGLEALAKALEAGFADRQRIADLLVREDLLDRDRVQEALGERSILPGDAELEAARRRGLADRTPAVAEPRGPWAEPGAETPAPAVADPEPPGAE